jgi:hypothetical protein
MLPLLVALYCRTQSSSLILSCVMLSNLTLPFVLSCPTQSCRVTSDSAPSSPLTCPSPNRMLSYLTLQRPALFCPVLPCPVHSHQLCAVPLYSILSLVQTYYDLSCPSLYRTVLLASLPSYHFFNRCFLIKYYPSILP